VGQRARAHPIRARKRAVRPTQEILAKAGSDEKTTRLSGLCQHSRWQQSMARHPEPCEGSKGKHGVAPTAWFLRFAAADEHPLFVILNEVKDPIWCSLAVVPLGSFATLRMTGAGASSPRRTHVAIDRVEILRMTVRKVRLLWGQQRLQRFIDSCISNVLQGTQREGAVMDERP